jgi:hypothetical protein
MLDEEKIAVRNALGWMGAAITADSGVPPQE